MISVDFFKSINMSVCLQSKRRKAELFRCKDIKIFMEQITRQQYKKKKCVFVLATGPMMVVEKETVGNICCPRRAAQRAWKVLLGFAYALLSSTNQHYQS